LAAAARYPDRIAAAASFYGTWLVSDAEESPHLSLSKVKGELYFGVHHGFAFPQRWCYDKSAAERHWERLIALYRRHLG